jgi:hypothetical protein
MEQQKITFNVTIQEANIIFASLSQMPYNQVALLIDNLKQQGVVQMSPKESNDQ